MKLRLLAVVSLLALTCGTATGQESGQGAPDNSTEVRSAGLSNYKLKGVLISSSSRLALIGGRTVERGDQVNGAEILAINDAGISILADGEKHSVGLGGTISKIRQPTNQSMHHSMRAEIQPDVDLTHNARANSSSRHVVDSGETLSGIALRYRKEGVTLNQMMNALYSHNVRAFKGDMNMLREGKVLRIPDVSEILSHAPAATLVSDEGESKRPPSAQLPQNDADVLRSKASYGPIKSGETLSGIAARIAHRDLSIDQAMIALYHANRHAFDDNINLLFAGAVLRVPGKDEYDKLAPELATTEVERQTRAWQTRHQQHAFRAVSHDNIVAANE